jgi:hypothetical protein
MLNGRRVMPVPGTGCGPAKMDPPDDSAGSPAALPIRGRSGIQALAGQVAKAPRSGPYWVNRHKGPFTTVVKRTGSQPMRTRLMRRWGYAVAALMGIFLVLGHGVARAQEANEEEEDSFEQKIIKGILGGIGVDVGQGAGIDYHERAPLVIPPSTELPPPQTATATPPDWPSDQKPKKHVSKKPRDRNGSVRQYQVERATASAAEMSEGAKPGAGLPTGPTNPLDNNENGGRPLTTSAINGAGNIFGNLFGGGKPEQGHFVGEPVRMDLTQPPVGYQTPSPTYPYGLAGAKAGPTTQQMNQTTDRSAADQTGAK